MNDTYSITELRHKTSEVLAAAKKSGYVSVLKNSKRDAYIVDPNYFLMLREAYEDYLDEREYDKAIKSMKKEKPIPFAKVVEEFKQGK